MKSRAHHFYLSSIILCWFFAIVATAQPPDRPADFSVEQAISRADIHRYVLADTAVINLYQGNGRFGGCYGPLGLHLDPAETAWHAYGPTRFMHIQHYARAKFGVDYLLPMFRIYWQTRPAQVNDYHQHQSFFDGTITTRWASGDSRITVTTWFDPVDRDMAGLKIHVQGPAPNIIIAPLQTLWLHYRQEVMQTSVIRREQDHWRIDLACLNAATTVFVKTDMRVHLSGTQLTCALREGDNTILLSVHKKPAASCQHSLSRTLAWWHAKWSSTGCLALPDPAAQKEWVRTMAYILYSHNDDRMGSAPPMGFTGIAWSFLFPQDLAFLQPLLLATGHLDIAKSWVEYFAERIEGMRSYTKRIFGAEGVFCPWAVPYAGFAGFHEPTPPTKNYYSIHNSGYLARMAEETGAFVDDPAWTERNVLPILRETARFYRSICTREDDGLWHLFVTPSTGQDENGGFNQKDYLCALYSAQYCFQKAIAYGLDRDGDYASILRDGLAFPALLTDRGFYYSNLGAKNENAGGQKHPVQLNELAFLPVHTVPSPSAVTAYKKRYDITINASLPHFAGWTVGEFLIAGSRLGEAAEWMTDWRNLVASVLADPDYIQLYESSGNKRSFYITTSGMVAQSLLNNVVDDWWGQLVIGQCIPWPGTIAFKNLYSRLGVSLNGDIVGQSATVRLRAWKDCTFEIHGSCISMKKGEIKTVKLNR